MQCGGVFRIGYVGNFGKCYDFEHLFEALGVLKRKGINNINLYMIGDGIERDKIEMLSKRHNIETLITGYLPYADMMICLSQCDVAINPIIKGAANSVVNKVGDYAAAGIPVVNTQDNDEYRRLLEMYNAGLNTIPENSEDIARKIYMLYQSQELRNIMGENNRKLFETLFDRSKTYEKILTCIMEEGKT